MIAKEVNKDSFFHHIDKNNLQVIPGSDEILRLPILDNDLNESTMDFHPYIGYTGYVDGVKMVLAFCHQEKGSEMRFYIYEDDEIKIA